MGDTPARGVAAAGGKRTGTAVVAAAIRGVCWLQLFLPACIMAASSEGSCCQGCCKCVEGLGQAGSGS